jgi:predicted deacylase
VPSIRGIDFDAPGRQLGSIDLDHSDNRHDNGVIPVPIAVLSGGPGPTTMLVAGTHGDEYEGQVVLQRLVRALAPEEVQGRLIVLPALNLPAVRAAARVSPLDGGNLNRAYPGDEGGGPTEQIAHVITNDLLPLADHALDLHSGGTTSVYLPSAFVYDGPDPQAFSAKRLATEAMGLPWSLVVPGRFEPRSFSAACDEAGVCMIATELGGGGTVSPNVVAHADQGLRRLLALWGHLDEAGCDEPLTTRWLRVDHDSAVRTPSRGLFEPTVALGDEVAADSLIGWIHPIEDLKSEAVAVRAPRAGVVAVVRRPPLVELGDHLFHLATAA